MGQKVHPFLLRVGFTKIWHSRWFAKSPNFADYVEEDYRIRNLIKKRYKQAAISRIIIERLIERVKIRIVTARPGIIIGRHGADIERLREDLNTLMNKEVSIDIEEVKNPSLDAQLVAENISLQLEKRIAFRRAVKRAMEQTINAGAKGIRASVAGRLGGAEMSRTESYKQGKIPLQTLRADIDYGFAESLTTAGLIGVKVWVYKGDVLLKKLAEEAKQAREAKEQVRKAQQQEAKE